MIALVRSQGELVEKIHQHAKHDATYQGLMQQVNESVYISIGLRMGC